MPVVPSAGETRSLRAAVLAWFAASGRRLEFRRPGADPWAVLVSEVMAQQTQVQRVAARIGPFLAVFPTPAAMAAASPAEVVRAWRGLGYNRRAIGLHRAASAIVTADGRVPADIEALEELPGVGPYTARAVAAIAYGRPVGAVDVNVRRVITRLVAAPPDALAPRPLQEIADGLVDPARPAEWTHALMDLGATVCRPLRPACPTCPVQPWCATARVGSAAAPPARLPAGSGAGATPGAGRRPAVRFERTTRWLRGRIVDRLRDLPPGQAVPVAGSLGTHGAEAVAAALRALAHDGIIELDAAGRARLPVGPGPGPVSP
ncbi:MAG: A/G-specific adenine glycosylase [Chloroflexi bacterium]|nr:A/G-specific adenine glycosylase [Chloroflexota bacterium]